MSSFFRQQLEEWVKNIDVKAERVLDVGGAQLPIKGRTKSWDVKDYMILDLPNPHQTDPSVLDGDSAKTIWHGDIEKKNLAIGYYGTFDTVFCLEVMEYVLRPDTVVRNLNDFLIPGGTLYISFPFIYPHHAPERKDYLRYTRWGAEKLLSDAGFVDIETTARVAQNDLSGLWASEKMHPMKGYQGHDEIGYMIKCRKA